MAWLWVEGGVVEQAREPEELNGSRQGSKITVSCCRKQDSPFVKYSLESEGGVSRGNTNARERRRNGIKWMSGDMQEARSERARGSDLD